MARGDLIISCFLMFCFKTWVQSDLDAEVDNIVNIDLLCVGLLLKLKLQEPT